jgi:ABC-2 type transport system permease protein
MVRKEFIQLFRDKKTRRLIILTPFIQLIMFGYVVTTDVRDVKVAVLDHCRTPESRMLADRMDKNPTFRITARVGSQREIDDLLLMRRAHMALTFPPDFARRLRSGKTAAVQILMDGAMSNMASVRIAHALEVVGAYNRELLRETNPGRAPYGQADARIRTWYNPNLDSRNFFVPGTVALLVMLLSLLLTSMAIIREKEAGTMEQLMVTPLSPSELIMGKTIPFIIIAQAQMVLVTVFGMIWFGVPMAGSAALLFFATCLFLLSTLGVGLFISTVSSTQQQAMMTTFFFALPFIMLSGFIFPIANMPAPVRAVTFLDPLRYFIVIIRGIFLKGTGLSALWPQFAGLAVLGAAVFTGAVTRFRKRLD